MAMKLFSSAFVAGASIPVKFTCEGLDISPSLSWQGVPGGTRSLALVMDDPDAPDPAAPQQTWVHWILYNLPGDTAGLPQGLTSDNLPPGTQEGLNDWNRIGYAGPCPPVGRHRYFHKLYALNVQLPDLGRVRKAALEAAMQGHVLDEAQLMGTYQKRVTLQSVGRMQPGGS